MFVTATMAPAADDAHAALNEATPDDVQGPGAAEIHCCRIFTSVTVLARLLASTRLLSLVTEVLRTILPPPGRGQLWNFSVSGSKRTTVFGLASDSLYQMASPMAEMP